MQIRNTMRNHLTPVRSTIIKKNPNKNAGEDVEKREPLYTVGGNVKLVQPLWKTVWKFLERLKTELPYNPSILLLGYIPRETIIQKGTCTPVFIAALFTIARTWKQLKCPSIKE